jgi:hypothetical protein
MAPTDDRPLNVLASVGLALGGVFGLAGTLAPESHLQSTAWAIDGVALVVAAALLACKFFRKGSEFVAAGFLVFAVGQGVILSGAAAGLGESVSSFGAGTALWAAALLLISVPREFARWVRLVGVATSVLFFITAARIFWGERILPTSSPLPFLAYPLFVTTFIGWIWSLLGQGRPAGERDDAPGGRVIQRAHE